MSFGSSDTQDIPAATDAGQVSVGATGPLSPRGIKAMQGAPTLDAPSPPGDPPPAGDWVDRGIVDVPVAALPEPEGVEDASDFEKATPEELKVGLMRLQEMKPMIESGEGANTDYWREFDRQRGLVHPHGYLKVYESFYGSDAIRLDKDGDRYDIVWGRHRIFMAKRMGIDTLPARVKEKVSL